MTAKRRVRFIGTSHVTGSSSRRNTGVRQTRRIFTKAWNQQSGEQIWPGKFLKFFFVQTRNSLKKKKKKKKKDEMSGNQISGFCKFVLFSFI